MHPVPERLPSWQAIALPIEMPTYTPYGQRYFAYGVKRATRSRAQHFQFERTQAGLSCMRVRMPPQVFT